MSFGRNPFDRKAFGRHTKHEKRLVGQSIVDKMIVIDVSAKGCIGQRLCWPKAASAKGCISKRLHRPKAASAKGCIGQRLHQQKAVSGKCCVGQMVFGQMTRHRIFCWNNLSVFITLLSLL